MRSCAKGRGIQPDRFTGRTYQILDVFTAVSMKNAGIRWRSVVLVRTETSTFTRIENCCYCREIVKSSIALLYWRLIITFDEATACQVYLYGNIQRRHWKHRCRRLSSLSAVRYILAADQLNSESLTLKIEAICSSETSVLTKTTRRHHILVYSILCIRLLVTGGSRTVRGRSELLGESVDLYVSWFSSMRNRGQTQTAETSNL
jgi:hypothetical protein